MIDVKIKPGLVVTVSRVTVTVTMCFIILLSHISLIPHIPVRGLSPALRGAADLNLCLRVSLSDQWKGRAYLRSPGLSPRVLSGDNKTTSHTLTL